MSDYQDIRAILYQMIVEGTVKPMKRPDGEIGYCLTESGERELERLLCDDEQRNYFLTDAGRQAAAIIRQQAQKQNSQ